MNTQIEITPEYLASQGLSASFPERFWAKVNKTQSCWLWTATKTNGYGMIKPNHPGPCIRAHRASWLLHFGPIPSSLCVLHNCPDGDNPACVNPNHLWLGTKHDNAKDMTNKGRSNRGEQRPQAKLTTSQVIAIRGAFVRGQSQRQIARSYGVSQTTIGRIIDRKKWSHVE